MSGARLGLQGKLGARLEPRAGRVAVRPDKATRALSAGGNHALRRTRSGYASIQPREACRAYPSAYNKS